MVNLESLRIIVYKLMMSGKTANDVFDAVTGAAHKAIMDIERKNKGGNGGKTG